MYHIELDLYFLVCIVHTLLVQHCASVVHAYSATVGDRSSKTAHHQSLSRKQDASEQVRRERHRENTGKSSCSKALQTCSADFMRACRSNKVIWKKKCCCYILHQRGAAHSCCFTLALLVISMLHSPHTLVQHYRVVMCALLQ